MIIHKRVLPGVCQRRPAPRLGSWLPASAARGVAMSGGADPQEAAINNVLSFFLLALGVGLFARWMLKTLPWENFKPPFTVFVFLLGIACAAIGEGSTGAFSDVIAAGASAHPHVILFLLLPLLLFDDASGLDFHVFYKEKSQALALAGPGVLASLFLTGLGVKYFFDYSFSWSEAMLLGSVLAATDPVAVVAALEELGAPRRLTTVIAGESLLNDGAAFVMFLIFDNYANGGEKGPGELIAFFLQLALGGVAWGFAVFLVVYAWLSFTFKDEFVELGVVLLGVFVAFFMGEHTLHVSGVLAVVTFGLLMSQRGKFAMSVETQQQQQSLFENLGFYSNTIIFFLSGVITFKKVLDEEIASEAKNWGYLILLYIWIHVVRAVVVAALFPFLRRSGYGVTWKEAVVMVYGGLRGAVGLSLGILLEAADTEGVHISKKNRRLINFHIAGIVLMTLLINGTTTDKVYTYLRLYKINPFRGFIYRKAIEALEHKYMKRAVALLKMYGYYRDADWETVEQLVTSLHASTVTDRGHLDIPEFDSVRSILSKMKRRTQSVHASNQDVTVIGGGLTGLRHVPRTFGEDDDASKACQLGADAHYHAAGIGTGDRTFRAAFSKVQTDENHVESAMMHDSSMSMEDLALMLREEEEKGSSEAARPPPSAPEPQPAEPEELEIFEVEDESDGDRAVRAAAPAGPKHGRSSSSIMGGGNPVATAGQLGGPVDTAHAVEVEMGMIDDKDTSSPPPPKTRPHHRVTLSMQQSSRGMRRGSLVDETQELAELVFNLLKANYRNQESHGLLDAEELVLLIDAADVGLESVYTRNKQDRAGDLSVPLELQHEALIKSITQPEDLERYVNRSQSCVGAIRFLTYNWHIIAVKCLIGYVRAVQEITHQFEKRGFSKLGLVCLHAQMEVNWKALKKYEKHTPHTARVVETVLMARVMIRMKKEKVDDLYLHGLLKETDRDELIEHLEQRDADLEVYRIMGGSMESSAGTHLHLH